MSLCFRNDVFLERHWKKILQDVRYGTLNRHLDLSKERRHERTRLTRAEHASRSGKRSDGWASTPARRAIWSVRQEPHPRRALARHEVEERFHEVGPGHFISLGRPEQSAAGKANRGNSRGAPADQSQRPGRLQGGGPRATSRSVRFAGSLKSRTRGRGTPRCPLVTVPTTTRSRSRRREPPRATWAGPARLRAVGRCGVRVWREE